MGKQEKKRNKDKDQASPEIPEEEVREEVVPPGEFSPEEVFSEEEAEGVGRNLSEEVEELEETEDIEESSPDSDLVSELVIELSEKLAEAEDANLRLSAEFDNFRRRSRKEREQVYTNAKIDLVKSFLPLFDGLDRARDSYIMQDSEEAKSMLEGINLLIKQGQDCLREIGVEEIDCENTEFDPNFHEAVQHIEDEQYGKNEVIEVLLKGYKAGDAVIRHSVVRVAN